MPSQISLQYPNGRTHEIEFPDDLKPGQEFELYGRLWKVVGVAQPPRSLSYSHRIERRLLCRQQPG